MKYREILKDVVDNREYFVVTLTDCKTLPTGDEILPSVVRSLSHTTTCQPMHTGVCQVFLVGKIGYNQSIFTLGLRFLQ